MARVKQLQLTRQNPLNQILPQQLSVNNLYDNVTLQFCMHYAFETASKARMMMENVSRYLRPGGTFIGTIPDSQLLLYVEHCPRSVAADAAGTNWQRSRKIPPT